MTPQLESITLTNFRSINLPVMIPLDAPVVLIHGQNGTGKTSILSGIELALTGDIPSLRRVDSDYREHLVHKSAAEARLDLVARGLPTGSTHTSLMVRANTISGQPLLNTTMAKTYSERCYLAQASLGRLLEIYQGQDPQSSSSPLTLFVKELLGLDVIESIVDGLHDAGDVRRIRNAVPAYAEVERSIKDLDARAQKGAVTLKEIEGAIATHLEKLKIAIVPLGLAVDPAVQEYGELLKRLEAKESESQLMSVARIRRDLLAAKERLNDLEIKDTVAQRTQVEESDLSARRELEEWREGPGLILNDIIESLLRTFPSLPSPKSVDPDVARSTALDVVDAESRRYAELVAKQEAIGNRLTEVDTGIERLEERSRRLDEQIGSHAANAGSLAQSLASLLPHIHSDECPVCGRDFAEVSKTPLVSEVSHRVSALNESAGLLEALSREKATTATQLASARRERDELVAGQSSQVIAESANTERARLQIAKQRLEGLAGEAARATALIQNANAATRNVSQARESGDQLSSLIETIRAAAAQLGEGFTYPERSLSEELARLLTIVEKGEETLNALEENRRTAITEIRALQIPQTTKSSLVKEMSVVVRELTAVYEAKQRADEAIEVTRTLSKTVLEVRTSIVQRVFNESLNRLWADLFTRLAPEENFVPAFALSSKSAGHMEAMLETIYRRGKRGGNPQTMLSAGNLNTAALTLFLSLHLSLDPNLPWLLIDDPVQSMDEVHISQFAALLRTLSKQCGRRVVIAIHERPLYEYLALELSPAFPEDKLITVELGRNASGDTVAKATHHIWQHDRAISAA
jgi:exonuclease SbcC